MTIALKSSKTISGWIQPDGSLVLNNEVYDPESTVKLRDYLMKHIKF